MQKKTATALSLSAVLAVSAAVGAGTFALFNDTETAENQSVAAGTLDLELGGTYQTEALNVTNFKPGDSIASKTLTFTNKGSLPGVLTVDGTVLGTDGVCTEPEQKAENGATSTVTTCASAGQLTDAITVTVSEGGNVVENMPLRGFAKRFPIGELAAGATKTYTFAFTYAAPAGGDNVIQGDTAALDLLATFDQK